MRPNSDTLDLREISAALRRGALWIGGGAVLGLAAGAATLTVLTPEYEASATVLLRSQVGGGASALSRLSGLLGVPGISGGSTVETEAKILTSRAVLGQVVDSLGLQARVVEPEGIRPDSLFTEVRLDPAAEGGVYRFERRGNGYVVEGKGVSGPITPGVPYHIPGGLLVLRRTGLPQTFAVEVSDREGAIARVAGGLSSALSGEIVELTYRAEHPALAAAVPNAMISRYLQRRKTTDRGVNQHRFEFLTRHADSIAAQLALAEGALRRHQETSGVLDPALAGRSDLERAMSIQSELENSEVEARALRSIIEKGASGRLSPRELAAYPTFLRNPAINSVLSRLLELETERIALLEKRTERDPEVVALTSSIEHLEGRLVSLSRDYLGGLERQGAELRRELGGYRSELSALPRQAEESYRREREVKRLSETLVALQTQLVEARLGAISEGGEVRQIDVAVPPRSPAFPNPVLNLLGGLLGGLFFGTIAAVGAARIREDVREPWEAELATGHPAVAFNPQHPLWLSGLGGARTALLLPAGRSVDTETVGERLVATATLQGR
ncbi:MAG TPA: Wzz/FepE/Etk N-terminal domain-containing protein, partial [Longimicrobiaceae bacterium]|nr:Wzz/FepE/Etk N-terminal domain-containing protein [Longimicrobiaceae bacterium]